LKSTVRVIPRLDIKGPNLVKGIEFEGNRVLGAAEYFAKKYYESGADELIYQDIVASLYRRNGLLDIIKKTSKEIFIPLTVAGGIRTIEDIREVLRAGADKVAINTEFINNPNLIKDSSRIFGSQCIVCSIEVYAFKGVYQCWADYGREVTNFNAVDWAKRAVDLGAGELLVTAIHKEGTGQGYDYELIEKVSSAVSVPVIACGGAGNKEDPSKVVNDSNADAVCMASILHYHYMKRINTHTMKYNKTQLRMGSSVDSGNIDFLRDGYGGSRELMVEPCSILSIKENMAEQGINVREIVNNEK
jgi:imidazole glycerol-phosphate synthase subunit HisF